MKKEEWIALLRITGIDEKAVSLATHAYEIGYEEAKFESIKQSPIIKGGIDSSENKESSLG